MHLKLLILALGFWALAGVADAQIIFDGSGPVTGGGSAPISGNLLLENGTDSLLLEDNSSLLCFEYSC